MTSFGSRTLLVPVDFSERSGAVTRWVADRLGAEGVLIAVHVLPELAPHEPGHLWGRVTDEARITKASAYLDQWLEERGVRGAERVVRIGGAPWRAICDVADERDVDAIVIAAHNEVSDRVFPLSTTTERVLRHAHCPVWVHR